MPKSFKKGKKQEAIVSLRVYCGIHSTYYDIEEEIIPYQFISWAKDRDSILVPDDMIYWYERKKERVPSTQLSRAKKRITELETQIGVALQQVEELKQTLANTKVELAAAKAQAGAPQEVVTVDAAPCCAGHVRPSIQSQVCPEADPFLFIFESILEPPPFAAG